MSHRRYQDKKLAAGARSLSGQERYARVDITLGWAWGVWDLDK
jgi:hypothetical protein